MPLGAPDVDRVAVLSRSSGIESGRGEGLPSGRIIYPGHYVIPAQRAGFLGADADQQAQRDVRVPPSGLCAASKALAWSSVKLLDGRPLRPRGDFTRAATLRPTRSSDSACRMARSSELRGSEESGWSSGSRARRAPTGHRPRTGHAASRPRPRPCTGSCQRRNRCRPRRARGDELLSRT